MKKYENLQIYRFSNFPFIYFAFVPQGQIILELVQENPEKRPSPTELLKYFNEDKDSIIARLKEENVKKDNLIHKLRDEIAQLEATIEKQRNSLGNT